MQSTSQVSEGKQAKADPDLRFVGSLPL